LIARPNTIYSWCSAQIGADGSIPPRRGTDPEWENRLVKAKLVAFGELQIEGERYTCDVVIKGGRIRRRRKGPSKPLRDRFGHTPLSIAEDIPWGGRRLIVGTGAGGALPITSEVGEEAQRRGIAIEALPTRDACRLLADLKPRDVYAVLHVTC
jgi:hypothetical protein